MRKGVWLQSQHTSHFSILLNISPPLSIENSENASGECTTHIYVTGRLKKKLIAHEPNETQISESLKAQANIIILILNIRVPS